MLAESPMRPSTPKASAAPLPPLLLRLLLGGTNQLPDGISLPLRTSAFSRRTTIIALGRSRPAADASREAVERWLLDGLDVSVGHRRCSCDPSQKNDAGRTP